MSSFNFVSPVARSELLNWRRNAQSRVEHHPGVGIEELEETRIEDDACGIAIPPGNGQLSTEGEGRHAAWSSAWLRRHLNVPSPRGQSSAPRFGATASQITVSAFPGFSQ